jgi:hypothetical protein
MSLRAELGGMSRFGYGVEGYLSDLEITVRAVARPCIHYCQNLNNIQD